METVDVIQEYLEYCIKNLEKKQMLSQFQNFTSY
jgi:hypothetical protein